jgi:hypothetical protein
MAYEAGVVDRLNYNSDIYDYFAKDDEWDTSAHMLPEAAQEWAGIETGNPDVRIDRAMRPDTWVWARTGQEEQALACYPLDPGHTTLAHLNDAGYSFSQIADVIEEQL